MTKCKTGKQKEKKQGGFKKKKKKTLTAKTIYNCSEIGNHEPCLHFSCNRP